MVIVLRFGTTQWQKDVHQQSISSCISHASKIRTPPPAALIMVPQNLRIPLFEMGIMVNHQQRRRSSSPMKEEDEESSLCSTFELEEVMHKPLTAEEEEKQTSVSDSGTSSSSETSSAAPQAPQSLLCRCRRRRRRVTFADDLNTSYRNPCVLDSHDQSALWYSRQELDCLRAANNFFIKSVAKSERRQLQHDDSYLHILLRTYEACCATDNADDDNNEAIALSEPQRARLRHLLACSDVADFRVGLTTRTVKEIVRHLDQLQDDLYQAVQVVQTHHINQGSCSDKCAETLRQVCARRSLPARRWAHVIAVAQQSEQQ